MYLAVFQRTDWAIFGVILIPFALLATVNQHVFHLAEMNHSQVSFDIQKGKLQGHLTEDLSAHFNFAMVYRLDSLPLTRFFPCFSIMNSLCLHQRSTRVSSPNSLVQEMLTHSALLAPLISVGPKPS